MHWLPGGVSEGPHVVEQSTHAREPIAEADEDEDEATETRVTHAAGRDHEESLVDDEDADPYEGRDDQQAVRESKDDVSESPADQAEEPSVEPPPPPPAEESASSLPSEAPLSTDALSATFAESF